MHLPTGVCLFSLLPATGRYYLLHFLPSTISYSTARGRVKSLLPIQKKSLPLKSVGFTSRSAAAMLCFLHLIDNGEEHVFQPQARASFCWLTYPHWFSYKNSRLSFTYQILNNRSARLFQYNKLCARGFTKSLREGKSQS